MSFPPGPHRYSCPDVRRTIRRSPPRYPAAFIGWASRHRLWWSWDARARDVFRRLDLRGCGGRPRTTRCGCCSRSPRSACGRRPTIREFLQAYDEAITGRDAARQARAPVVERERQHPRQRHDRLLLGGVRAAPVAADLRRRPGRAGRRPLQGGQRPRRAAGRRRLHVSAGLLPPAGVERRLAAGTLRADRRGRTRRSRPPSRPRAGPA